MSTNRPRLRPIIQTRSLPDVNPELARIRHIGLMQLCRQLDSVNAEEYPTFSFKGNEVAPRLPPISLYNYFCINLFDRL